MEYLALYDDHNQVLSKEKIERSRKLEIHPGKYFKIVLVFIQNSEGKFLIQQTSLQKNHEFATTGGHVQYGVSSLETARQEVLEELGIDISLQDFELYDSIKYDLGYRDCYYVKRDVTLDELVLQSSEVESAHFLTIEEIQNLINEGKFRKGNMKPFQILLQKKKLS